MGNLVTIMLVAFTLHYIARYPVHGIVQQEPRDVSWDWPTSLWHQGRFMHPAAPAAALGPKLQGVHHKPPDYVR